MTAPWHHLAARQEWVPARQDRGAARQDWLLLALLPVLLHAPEWLGIIKTDPRLFASGLGVDIGARLVGGQAGYLDPNSAYTAQDLGHLAAEQWLHGQVPWWNPFIGVGAPLAAEMQPAALFLPFVLLMHFTSGWLWLHITMQAIAALGGYALLGALGLGRPARLLGAILYGGSGVFAWFSHGPERVAAFLPWMLLGVEQCRWSLRGGATVATALAGSIYAGFPETAYLDGLLALAWVILRGSRQEGSAPGFRSGFTLRFALRLAAGGTAGLLLAGPAIWPFIQYLRHADTGGHTVMARLALGSPGIAMMLMPYINGPLAGISGRLFVIWGNVGGYVGVSAALLALAGTAGRRERGLRLLLLGWIILCVARSAGVAPAIWLVNLLPLVGQTAFWRYIIPSLAMAASVLAACAVQDWQSAPHPARARAAGLAGLLLIGGAAALCIPAARPLWTLFGYRAFFIASLIEAVALCVALTVLLARPARALPLRLLCLLVGLDVAGQYCAARLAAPLHGHLDTAPAQFLRDHAGLARVVSGPRGLGLNESAWDGFAGIDETMLPAPANWSAYTHATLQQGAITFQPVGLDGSALVRLLPEFRALGVGWLVTGRGAGPAHMLASTQSRSDRIALRLTPGRSASGAVPQGLPGRQAHDHVGLDLGTYAGLANGTLTVTLAGTFGTATGTADLKNAVDNGVLDFRLDRPIPPHQPLQWRLLQHGSAPAALWLYGPAREPRLTTAADWPGPMPQRVFSSATKEIYRLADPAPYWRADCRLDGTASRTALRTICPGPATLHRQELFDPGWSARVNGKPVTIYPDGLFQRLDLPAGAARIRWRYAPPGISWAYAASLIGLLATLALAWPPRLSSTPVPRQG